MTRFCRSGLAALGVLVLAGATADAAPKRPVARTTARPAGVTQGTQQGGSVKVKNRDRGSLNRPHPQSAYFALGLNRRFLQTGDAWVMAWSSLTRGEIRKSTFTQLSASRLWGPATYVRYQVTKVWRHRLGNTTRTLAKIRISYGTMPTRTASTYAEATVDQFWNPVAFRLVGEDTPYGKRQDKDTRRVLHGVGEFPLYVGDLENVPGRAVRPPRVIPALARHRIPAGTTLAIKVNNGVNVHGFTYWTPGRPYASYVVSQHHQGILVSQQLAR